MTMRLKSLVAALAMVALLGIAAMTVTGYTPATHAQQGNGVTTPTPSNDGNTPDPYDCEDFDNARQVRAVYASEYPDNTSQLDKDGDGIPCEDAFPGQSGSAIPTTATSATTTATSTSTPTPNPTTTSAGTTTTEATTESTAETTTTTVTTTTATTTSTTKISTTTGDAGGAGKAKQGGNGKAKQG